MISEYSKNKQKYEKAIEYVNSHPNISEDIKKEIVQKMEKYRISIYCMEEQEVYELLERCATTDSDQPIKKELHCIIFGGVHNDTKEHKTSSQGKDIDYIY